MNKFLITKGLYSSGMVLQRERTGSIFGKSLADTEVVLKFRNEEYSVKSDNDGNWKIEFNPGKAGGPFKLEIFSSDETIVFNDVYVGEVWVSSGQSNAQLPMERLYYKYKNEFSLPENPNVRMITVPISYSFDGEKDSVENPQWLYACEENLGKLSGTAYFFAKKINEELNVPVGIINASQGGSPITAWMDYDSLKDLKKEDLLQKVDFWKKPGEIEKKRNSVLTAQKKWDSEFFANDIGSIEQWEKLSYSEISDKWEDCELPGDFEDFEKNAGVLWLKKEIELTQEQADILNSKKTHLWMGTIQDADKIWVNKAFCGITYYTYPPRRYIVPAGAFVAGKNTVTVRVQKNGQGPIRFYKEKPYFIFTDDVQVQPSITRNIEHFEGNSSSSGIKISLDGKWKKCASCKKEVRPGEMFFEWEPTALYNSMLAPAFNYGISGALWYQGESNSWDYGIYKSYLEKMVSLWRRKFVYAPEDMPVVIAQLPNWANGYEKTTGEIEDWAELRQAQKNAVEELKNAGLAVLIDAGEWNDLHPESKKTVGYRAGREALRIAYGKKFEPSPKVEYCQKDVNVINIRFDTGSSKLKAYFVENDVADFNKEAKEIYGFEVVTENSVVEVSASLISDVDVEVCIPAKFRQLKELRYLWKNNPWIINFYSSEGIPVAPFKIPLE